ncbi:MAG: 7-cyano-7-deazaguanine synthase QueC [Schwartzia sp.]|nr:7-cyano-7-deazaguanine synthase QueC [Schwartzia sp. (in: firmicutes)]
MKAVILSSGGVDSTTCLALAVKEQGTKNVATISVFYGQKHQKELEAARLVAEHYGVRHAEYDLASVFRGSTCALLSGAPQEIEHRSYAEQLEGRERDGVSTYVPFRNGLMLAAAASAAGSIFENEDVLLYLGAHADDAAGNAYADCSEEFLHAMGEAISVGTYGRIRLVAPFAGKPKAEVVKTGLALGVPYELTWSCYEGGDVPCGACATCRDRAAAFRANGAKDPALAK